jgi:outer membrane protein assembly factor BamA
MNKYSWHNITLIIFLTISLTGFIKAQQDSTRQELSANQISYSMFPVLMYDSDIGFGFGGKGIIKNQFRRDESFDLTLFGSTKGEQWYVFTFSIPDFEIRQGTDYPIGFDLKLEYDKFLKSNFFGFGNDSKNNDQQFPKEFLNLEMTVGRAFTKQIIGEIGLFFHHTSVYDFEGVNPLVTYNVPGAGEQLTSFITTRLRWDTRNSQINPHRGWNLSFNSDFAQKILGGDYKFTRYRLEISKYQTLFTQNHILAFRFWCQHINGTAPYYEQSIIGGGWSARGFKADRFIDMAFTLISMEYRFSIYKKLGGVLFFDTGRVYPDIQKTNFHNWKTSLGSGLRYYLENFVARLDIGFSNEGTRIYFNFGHVF